MPKMARVVTIDIETAPIESYHWGLWDQNIGLSMVKVDWTILSFSAKWLDSKAVLHWNTGGRGKHRVRDDKHVLDELWKILDQADVVVVQNGRAFDIKKINARLLFHGFKPYSPIKVIDTFASAKKHFDFTSNSLEWLSKHLCETKKSEHKQFPGFTLWAECLKDNPAAWKEMQKYNDIDVLAAEQLYLKLRPWIEDHPNLAVFSSGEEVVCPKCGCEVKKDGFAYTMTGKYQQYQCKSCGAWARSRYTLNTKTKRESILR